jgi:4-amino-4-deoxy-L-arabinose transferase-like glycosyltransferase
VNESRLRRFYPVAITVLGLLLFFPGLSAFGLWDPYEIRVADAARALATGTWTFGPQLGHPPLLVWIVAAGFKLLGVGELGGRLPIAVTAVLALLATYYAGAPLVGRRGALLGTVALATTPAFLLGARMLTSDAPTYLGAALAVGGLARATWPEPGTSTGRRALDLLLGVFGLVIGQLSTGLVVGVISPVAAVTATLGLFGGGMMLLAFAIALVALLARAGWAYAHTSGYSNVLGGNVHALLHTSTISTHLLRVGFQMFPWIALSPPAAIRALDDRQDEQQRIGGTLLIAWTAILWVAGTLHSASVQDLHVPLGVPLLLLVGGYLDSVLADPAAKPLPFAALAVALAALVLGRDFFLFPEQFVGVHMLEPVRWPGPLTHVPYVVMAFAAFWAGTIGLGLGVPLAPANASDEKRVHGRRLLLGAAAASTLVFALITTWWIVPQVSKHLSARDIYGKTKTLDPNAPIGQYRFNATGASYYASGRTPVTLATTKDLFDFLAKPERVFVLAGSEELPSIDQFARQQKASYVVVDDSNSRYLVLSNRLGQNERDLNPLKRFISEQPPKPEHVLEANFENKVKLIGYDMPAQVSRGQEFKVRLYFQVLQPLGASYKVFIHFDGAGTRFNGDHVPLEGRFPTPNWVPGYYITDEHTLAPDRAMQPSGVYRTFMGFFSGESRLKVVEGPQDGENRVKLGAIQIR